MVLNTLRTCPPLILKGDSCLLVSLLESCTGQWDVATVCDRTGWRTDLAVAVLDELQRRGVLTLHPLPIHDEYAVYPRYVRQMEFLEERLGSVEAAIAAQRKLLSTHVTVIGLGGSAHWLIAGLAAAGIRRWRLLDPDIVSLSNLSRQFLFAADSIGRPKVDAASEYLHRCDTDFQVEGRQTGVWDERDAADALDGTDLAIVTVGHVPSRITAVTNRAAVAAGVPLLLVGGATWGPFVVPGRTPCVACLERHLRASSPRTFDTLAERSPRFPTGVHTPVLVTAIADRKSVV